MMSRRSSRDARIAALRRKYPVGLASADLLFEATQALGRSISLPTLRKYVQMGLVMPGRRTDLGDGRGHGSRGVYGPAAALQLIEAGREMDRRRASKGDVPPQAWLKRHRMKVAIDRAEQAVEEAFALAHAQARANKHQSAHIRLDHATARDKIFDGLVELSIAAHKHRHSTPHKFIADKILRQKKAARSA